MPTVGLWADIAEIATLTGVTVDAPTRALAAAAVELSCGAIESVTRIYMTNRDGYWLRQAVCFQAAWLYDQPDYLVRSAVTEVQEDGQRAFSGNADWLTLAPLARKAIKRLSWRGTRTITLAGENGERLSGRTRWTVPSHPGINPLIDEAGGPSYGPM